MPIPINIRTDLDILLSTSEDMFFIFFKKLTKKINKLSGNRTPVWEEISSILKDHEHNINGQCLHALIHNYLPNETLEHAITILKSLQNEHPIAQTCLGLIYDENEDYERSIPMFRSAYEKKEEYSLIQLHRLMKLTKITEEDFIKICLSGLEWNSGEARVQLEKMLTNSDPDYHRVLFFKCVDTLLNKIKNLEKVNTILSSEVNKNSTAYCQPR